jgi:hypothetical protein
MIVKEKIRWRGVTQLKDAFRVNTKTYVVSGNLVRTATLQTRWQEDVDNPAEVIRALKSAPIRTDLFKFWQRIPECEPKFAYYKEWRNVAVIPVTTFDHWWNKQINTKTRNMVRKSGKLGVSIHEVAVDENFVREVMDIYNETPVRRGKPFWHYGKDFKTVKEELLAGYENSLFIAAHYQQELIGFVKLLLTDRYAMMTLILDKISHRDKSPMNGMIAKAVEICANQRIPFLAYTVWRRGDQAEFQKRNGFEKIPVPEYFVPLTLRGEIALRLGLHKGLKGALPEKLIVWLLALRSRWYASKHTQNKRSRLRSPEPKAVGSALP